MTDVHVPVKRRKASWVDSMDHGLMAKGRSRNLFSTLVPGSGSFQRTNFMGYK